MGTENPHLCEKLLKYLEKVEAISEIIFVSADWLKRDFKVTSFTKARVIGHEGQVVHDVNFSSMHLDHLPFPFNYPI